MFKELESRLRKLLLAVAKLRDGTEWLAELLPDELRGKFTPGTHKRIKVEHFARLVCTASVDAKDQTVHPFVVVINDESLNAFANKAKMLNELNALRGEAFKKLAPSRQKGHTQGGMLERTSEKKQEYYESVHQRLVDKRCEFFREVNSDYKPRLVEKIRELETDASQTTEKLLRWLDDQLGELSVVVADRNHRPSLVRFKESKKRFETVPRGSTSDSMGANKLSDLIDRGHLINADARRLSKKDRITSSYSDQGKQK